MMGRQNGDTAGNAIERFASRSGNSPITKHYTDKGKGGRDNGCPDRMGSAMGFAVPILRSAGMPNAERQDSPAQSRDHRTPTIPGTSRDPTRLVVSGLLHPPP